MKTVFEADGSRLVVGECLQTLLELKAAGEVFDCLLTDPPYASGALHIGGKFRPTAEKYQQTGTVGIHPDFSGDARDQLSWLTWCAIWLNACRGVLRVGSPVMVFCDWRQIGAAIQCLQAGGFIYRGIVVWRKPTARPMGGRFRSQCEYVVWGSNGSMPLRDVYLPGIFEHSVPVGSRRVHASQKPVGLLRDLLAIVPAGGRVLDPFAGSGSTLIAARELGLSAVGIEENETIGETAAARLAEDSFLGGFAGKM